MNCRALLTLLLTALLLGGCASNKIVSSLSDPTFDKGLSGPVLVIAVAHQETARRIYEDSLTATLQEQGVNSVAGYTVMAEKGLVDYQKVIAAVKENGAGSILVTRLDGVQEATSYRTATGAIYDTIDRLEQDPVFFNPNPKTATTYSKRIQLRSRLYDVESEKLVWSAVSESKDPVMTRKYFDKLTGLISKELGKSGLL